MVAKAVASSLLPFHLLTAQSLAPILGSRSRHKHTRSWTIMIAAGRGSIAQVQYTGDESAGEIKKLLDAVVRIHNHACSCLI